MKMSIKSIFFEYVIKVLQFTPKMAFLPVDMWDGRPVFIKLLPKCFCVAQTPYPFF